jgi:hypothetical protein
MKKTGFWFLMVLTIAFSACGGGGSSSSSGGGGQNDQSVIDISNTNDCTIAFHAFTFGYQTSSQEKRFQTFIADNHTKLDAVEIKIRKNSSTDTYHNVTVELYDINSSGLPYSKLAETTIDTGSLGRDFTVIRADLNYDKIVPSTRYAIVLGQVNLGSPSNAGYEWCTQEVNSEFTFGKLENSTWTEESVLGDGWVIVYMSSKTNILFSDNFQRATGLIGNGWKNSYGDENNTNFCDIIDESSGANVCRIRGNGFIANGDSQWADYSFYAKFKISLKSDNVRLSGRNKDYDTFYYIILQDGILSLGKYLSGWGAITNAPISYDANKYYSLKVIFKGSNIKVFFDKQTTPILDVNDTSIDRGGIGIGSYHNPIGGSCYFDDLVVTQP